MPLFDAPSPPPAHPCITKVVYILDQVSGAWGQMRGLLVGPLSQMHARVIGAPGHALCQDRKGGGDGTAPPSKPHAHPTGPQVRALEREMAQRLADAGLEVRLLSFFYLPLF